MKVETMTRKFGIGERVVLNSDIEVKHGSTVFFDLKPGAEGIVVFYEDEYPIIKLCRFSSSPVWISSLDMLWDTHDHFALCADTPKTPREQLLKDWSDRRISYEIDDCTSLVDFIERHASQIHTYLHEIWK